MPTSYGIVHHLRERKHFAEAHRVRFARAVLSEAEGRSRQTVSEVAKQAGFADPTFYFEWLGLEIEFADTDLGLWITPSGACHISALAMALRKNDVPEFWYQAPFEGVLLAYADEHLSEASPHAIDYEGYVNAMTVAEEASDSQMKRLIGETDELYWLTRNLSVPVELCARRHEGNDAAIIRKIVNRLRSGEDLANMEAVARAPLGREEWIDWFCEQAIPSPEADEVYTTPFGSLVLWAILDGELDPILSSNSEPNAEEMVQEYSRLYNVLVTHAEFFLGSLRKKFTDFSTWRGIETVLDDLSPLSI